MPGYQIAAKTGTARKVQESGGYRDAAGNFHYIATVAGFFPADDPQFSMIVIIDEPAPTSMRAVVQLRCSGSSPHGHSVTIRSRPGGRCCLAASDSELAVGPTEGLANG